MPKRGRLQIFCNQKLEVGRLQIGSGGGYRNFEALKVRFWAGIADLWAVTEIQKICAKQTADILHGRCQPLELSTFLLSFLPENEGCNFVIETAKNRIFRYGKASHSGKTPPVQVHGETLRRPHCH